MKSRGTITGNTLFCSYCGMPPVGRTDEPVDRLCARCGTGVMVSPGPGPAPRYDEPFLILDATLTVRAVSRAAEAAFGVAEPQLIGASLETLLVPDCSQAEHLRLLVGETAAGEPVSGTVALRPTTGAETRFMARIAGCGPPQGALVVLSPAKLR